MWSVKTADACLFNASAQVPPNALNMCSCGHLNLVLLVAQVTSEKPVAGQMYVTDGNSSRIPLSAFFFFFFGIKHLCQIKNLLLRFCLCHYTGYCVDRMSSFDGDKTK